MTLFRTVYQALDEEEWLFTPSLQQMYLTFGSKILDIFFWRVYQGLDEEEWLFTPSLYTAKQFPRAV